ncbi:MAG: membrane protein insertion efficiency factor YidD [Defluviitaleaceae bacterium]|nr:membrane protein insertion efficiency factor YidD [Defluviitaleaceae bacterium]
MKSILLFLLRFYKKAISPLLPRACRFYPTCSEYMAAAIVRHGTVKGLWLGTYRLLRCQPLCESGYDPVPERFIFLPRLTEQIFPSTDGEGSLPREE